MKIVQNEQRQGFRKPVVVNDWESLGYFMTAVQGDCGGWCLAQQDPKEEIRTGETIYVLWPNNGVSEEVIQAKPYHTRYGDMGHTYSVTTQKLFIVVVFNGHPVRIPLEELWIRKDGERLYRLSRRR